MEFLGCLFSILLVIFFLLVAGANVIWYRLRKMFGLGDNPFEQKQEQQTNSGYRTNQQTQGSGTKPKKKVFADDEGEYVDFEEIKEDGK